MGSAFLMLPTRSIILNTNVPLILISFSVSSSKLWCPYLILETVKDQSYAEIKNIVLGNKLILSLDTVIPILNNIIWILYYTLYHLHFLCRLFSDCALSAVCLHCFALRVECLRVHTFKIMKDSLITIWKH